MWSECSVWLVDCLKPCSEIVHQRCQYERKQLCDIQLIHPGAERASKEAIGDGINHGGRERNPSNAKPLDENVIEHHVDAAIDHGSYEKQVIGLYEEVSPTITVLKKLNGT